MKLKRLLFLALSAALLVSAASYGYKMYLFRLGLEYASTRNIPKLKSLISNRHDVATLLLGTVFVNQDKEMFELLLDSGANPKQSWLDTKWGKEPILLQIAGHEDSFWIDSALKHGVDPNWRLRNVPLLTIAIDHHRPKNATLLMDYGADVNSRFDNQSQIDMAWNQWQHEITFELLQRGAEINSPSQLLKSMIGGMQVNFRKNDGEQVRTSALASGSIEYLEKILDWFDDHDLDWRNATHSDPTTIRPVIAILEID